MKRHLFLLISTLLLTLTSTAQTAFRHVTTATNTTGHITTLNHAQLNGNPNAVVFAQPIYSESGDRAITGAFRVTYLNSRWVIAYQNTNLSIAGVRFQILAMPAGASNVIVHNATSANMVGKATVLDHPALNGNPNAILLVTQQSDGNNHEIAVQYQSNRWSILNLDGADLPVNARFSVMIATADNVPGFSNARAFVHTHTTASQLTNNPGYTVLDNAIINGNADANVFLCQQSGSASNPNSMMVWYDSPNDNTNYKNGYWLAYGSNPALQVGAKINVIAIGGNPTPQPARDLTGFYRGDNGNCGQAYIRQIGNNVYWFGEHPNGSFGHVFSGTISGNTLTGNLWDVPKGTLMNKGNCVYSISADGNTLTLTGGTIGCNVLSKTTLPATLPASRPMQPGSGALTGVWDCNDGAATYVREDGNDFIFFSEAKNNGTRPGFANLYIGKRNGNTITGNWIDVPKGTHLGSGAMTLRVESDTRFVRVGEANGYGGGVWTRGSDANDPRYWNFEIGHINGWIKDGNAFDGQPNSGNAPLRLPDTWRKTVSLGGSYWRDIIGLFPYFNGYQGQYWVASANMNIDSPFSAVDIPGDYATGTMFSKEFSISNNYISYLVSGFSAAKLCRVGLLVLDDGTIQKTYSYQGWETRLVGNKPVRFPVTRSVALPTYSIEGKNYVAYYFGTRSITDILNGANVNINDLLSKDALESDVFTRQHFQLPPNLQGKKARIAIIDMDEKGHINVDDIRFENTLSPPIQVPQPALPLWGFVDMHTHPATQHGFGKELFWGQNDGNPALALGSCNCIHNFVIPPFDGSCGQQNFFRNKVVDEIDNKYKIPVHNKVAGYPDFAQWPKNRSVLHQQMWWEWIKRAKDGGLRVMVALAVNSHLLADAAETSGSYDDEQAIEDQIEAIKVLARNHPTDFEIALNPADLRRIVSSGKLAVILGVETDNIGNFYAPANPTPSRVRYNSTPNREEVVAEIDKLWNLGVRYIFPIHLTNNVFGGSAIYESSFNVANKYNTGKLFEIDTVNTTETGIGFKLKSSHETFSNSDNIKNIESGFEYLMAGLYDETSNFLNTFGINANILPNHIMPNVRGNYPKYTDPGENIGHRNKIGLTELGKFSIKYMMQKGMMIDIDHMSEKSADSTLIIASFFGYPVNSGHNGLRGANGTENGRTNQQLATIRNLGGLLGLGHGGEASGFVSNYRKASKIMGYRQICIGTDVNGFYPLPDTSIHTINYDIVRLSKSATGNKVWDYNKDGMAHYGLFPDFIEGVDKAGLTDNELGTFFLSAEYFAQMWEKCERQKTQVR